MVPESRRIAPALESSGTDDAASSEEHSNIKHGNAVDTRDSADESDGPFDSVIGLVGSSHTALAQEDLASGKYLTVRISGTEEPRSGSEPYLLQIHTSH
jgi:predicted SPOUT superfamily RNA methylase MTH1